MEVHLEKKSHWRWRRDKYNNFVKLKALENVIELKDKKGKTTRLYLDSIIFSALIERDYKPIHSIELMDKNRRTLFTRQPKSIAIFKLSDWKGLEVLLKYLVWNDVNFIDWKYKTGLSDIFELVFISSLIGDLIGVKTSYKKSKLNDLHKFTYNKLEQLKNQQKENGFIN
ncbi:hypothetical protein [Flammeovirga sp. OC4]|uniref:hypothetical protein n=1 Tax=Flammeovirga sp. OC4 TaxID=1382345 RepID=UPI0005C60419|nr:hypothetical protein [Flammeovirga sp. OC4]